MGKFSRMRFRKAVRKVVMDLTAEQKEVQNLATVLYSVGAGRQGSASAAVPGYINLQNLMLNSMPSADPGAPQQDVKLNIKQWKRRDEMTNMATTPIHVQVYKGYARTDIPKSIGNSANPTTLSTDYAAELWNIGMSDQWTTPQGTSVNTTNNDITSIGTTPFMSKLFCQYCKITKVKKFTVQGGQSFTINVNIFNRFYNLPKDNTTDYVARKGDKFYIVVSHGTPIRNGDTGVVSTALHTIAVVATRYTVYKYVKENVGSLTIADGITKAIISAPTPAAAYWTTVPYQTSVGLVGQTISGQQLQTVTVTDSGRATA